MTGGLEPSIKWHIKVKKNKKDLKKNGIREIEIRSVKPLMKEEKQY
jgi:hypothetical protein